MLKFVIRRLKILTRIKERNVFFSLCCSFFQSLLFSLAGDIEAIWSSLGEMRVRNLCPTTTHSAFFFLRWRHRTKAPLITFLSDGTSSRATNIVSDTVTTFNKCFFARTMAIESEQMKTFFLFYFWLARWKSFSFVNIHEISIVSQTYRIVYAVFYCQPLNGAISPATKWLARTMNHMKFHLKRHQFWISQ